MANTTVLCGDRCDKRPQVAEILAEIYVWNMAYSDRRLAMAGYAQSERGAANRQSSLQPISGRDADTVPQGF